MSKELVISSNRHETKVAILEDDQLVEIYFQRANEYSLAGSIHKGKVTRVLPGMQSAFVDLGLERDTFLYVSDFLDEDGEEYDKIATSADEKAIHRLSARSDVRNEPHAEAPRQKQSGPPVTAQHTTEEPAATQSEPAAVAAAPAPERQPERDQRDPRGRRSRRRRMRGGGFPDSKYASEVNAAPPGEPRDVERQESPQESLSDVILLPGESLAKYSNWGMAPASAEPVVEEEDESAPGADSGVLPDEDAIEKIDTRENELFSETLATGFPDPSYVPPPVSTPAADQAPAPESVSTHSVDATDADAEPELESSDADEPETGADDPQDQFQPSAEEEVGPSEIEAEAILGEADVEETAPASPVSASVREQSGRYPHRATRRMRRRRGGDRERHNEAAAPVSELVAERQGRDSSRESQETPRDTRDKPVMPSISDLLREGQEIIVQIAKEPLGQKGARITSHIALPGRYVVYMPTLEHLGVSRKIASDEERQRLKRILQAHRAGVTGGFIVRTAGEGHTEAEIGSDMSYLYNLWLDMRQKAEKKPAPVLLHHDLDIVQRILRDQLSDMFKAIWVDSEEIYESVVHFLQRFQPALVARVKLYTRAIPIFEAFNVTQEIEKALRPKVWLKSGGYIVINQTEALVAIDVNTGKYVGKSNRLEDTITKTNTEAVKEIVRQIRLRDLGGIIVVDFIDMDERKNRQKVMQALEESMRADRAPYKILQFNDFGLVAITRKRVRQSLERTLCSPCPTCEGAAYVKSVMTVVGEILQEATKLRPIIEGKNVVLRAHPDVAKHLKSSRNTYLEEIEEVLGRPVLVTSDPSLHPDKFDLAW